MEDEIDMKVMTNLMTGQTKKRNTFGPATWKTPANLNLNLGK